MAGFWSLPSPADAPDARPGKDLGEFRHSITHHRYTFRVYEAALTDHAGAAGFDWFDPAQLSAIPLSTTARKALRLAGIFAGAPVVY